MAWSQRLSISSRLAKILGVQSITLLTPHQTALPAHAPLEIRHTCEESDGLTSYAYTQHDGRRYSSQNLVDGKINAKLNIKFLKNDKGDEWAVRITGEPLDGGEHHEFGWVELE